MQSSAQTFTNDAGATLELGTIYAPNGTPHTARGAHIDLAAGHVFAYISGAPTARGGDLTTWQGEVIGTWRRISSWRQIAPYGNAETYTMTAVSAKIDGDSRAWFGRYNADWSQLVHLRPRKGG